VRGIPDDHCSVLPVPRWGIVGEVKESPLESGFLLLIVSLENNVTKWLECAVCVRYAGNLGTWVDRVSRVRR